MNGLKTAYGFILLLGLLLILACSNPEEPERNIEQSERIVVVSRAQKIHQIVGDFDNERQEFTLNRTATRYGLIATDLGVPFTHGGRTFVLFGDSFGGDDPNDDAIAYTTDTNPDDGIGLDFIQKPDGTYKAIVIPGVRRDGYEVPVEGVSLGGKMYIYFATDWSTALQSMTRTVLARSDDDGYTFTYLADFSTRRFINVSIETILFPDWPGFPDEEGEGLVIFGSGVYRKSQVYLAFQPADDVEDPSQVHYFIGCSNSGTPRWSSDEGVAVPLFDQSGVGELSVTYNPTFGKWIMLYNNGDPRGINMRTADRPWGPWSDVQVVFHPWDDGGYGHFMHVSWETARVDSVHDRGRENEWGGEYGPYQYGELARATADSITIYFNLSTWNPYTVVLMKATLCKE